MLMVCRVWGVSVASILALTLSNILLTVRVLHSRDDGLPCGGVTSPRGWTAALQDANLTAYLAFLRDANIVTDAMFNSKKVPCKSDVNLKNNSNTVTTASASLPFVLDNHLGRWDNRRIYKTHDHVYTGPSYRTLTDKAVVSLATQASVDRLYWLVQAARHWTEPISVAVFTPDIEYGIAKIYFQYLTTCFPFLGEKITVHFTYPKDHPPRPLVIRIQNLPDLCDQPVTVLRQLLKHRSPKMMSWRERMPYPQNVLRNVARKNTNTEWVFLVDVDIVSIPHLSKVLTAFLKEDFARKCQMCAFVIPTYEIDEKSPMPSNKSMLLKLVDSNKARPFHQKVFVHNQHATNFSLWQSSGSNSSDIVSVSHKVTNFEFFYEPFYVARDTTPPHDERFLGYGFTRNTQVYEMFVSGHEFYVLSPVFTIHWGMQVKKGRPQWREKQNNNNRKLFEGFKKEIFGRYQKDPLGMMKPKKRIIGKSYKRRPIS